LFALWELADRSASPAQPCTQRRTFRADWRRNWLIRTQTRPRRRLPPWNGWIRFQRVKRQRLL